MLLLSNVLNYLSSFSLSTFSCSSICCHCVEFVSYCPLFFFVEVASFALFASNFLLYFSEFQSFANHSLFSYYFETEAIWDLSELSEIRKEKMCLQFGSYALQFNQQTNTIIFLRNFTKRHSGPSP